MNRKQRKTLAALFANPVRANIAWDDVESLLRALGADVVPGGGSMMGFNLNGVPAVLHRPHPGHELSKPGVRAVRDFLVDAGEWPERVDEGAGS
jgi:hypothetical protein